MSDENLIWPSVDTHQAVARRRRDLYDAVRGLESAVAPPSGLADRRIDIEHALSYLLAALEDHFDEIESEGGLSHRYWTIRPISPLTSVRSAKSTTSSEKPAATR